MSSTACGCNASAWTSFSMGKCILQAVKLTLAGVIKDTATPHGMRHPLLDATIQDLRQCLALISRRECELAQAAGRPDGGELRYSDEPGGERSVIRAHKRKPMGKGG